MKWPVFEAISACTSPAAQLSTDRKSTRLNSSHDQISYAVFCLKKKKNAVGSLRVDVIRFFSDSSFYLILPSEHCRCTDFERRAHLKQVRCDSSAAYLGCTLDHGLVISLTPCV